MTDMPKILTTLARMAEQAKGCRCAGAGCGTQMFEDESAIDAVAEYIAANNDLLIMYRIKWGNLDPDANKVYDRAIAAHARMKGETK